MNCSQVSSSVLSELLLACIWIQQFQIVNGVLGNRLDLSLIIRSGFIVKFDFLSGKVFTCPEIFCFFMRMKVVPCYF